MTAENDCLKVQSSSTLMRAAVKACLPGPVGKFSSPQAPMISLIPCAVEVSAGTVAQSSKKRTSDFAFPSKFWIADQFTEGDSGSWLLVSFSQASFRIQDRMEEVICWFVRLRRTTYRPAVDKKI